MTIEPAQRSTTRSESVILSLKRLQNGVKDNSWVSFGEKLTLGARNSETELSLSAVVVHNGCAAGGHFTTFRKFLGNWFFIDDSRQTQKLSFQEVHVRAATKAVMFVWPRAIAGSCATFLSSATRSSAA
jgi:hypothetical protein